MTDEVALGRDSQRQLIVTPSEVRKLYSLKPTLLSSLFVRAGSFKTAVLKKGELGFHAWRVMQETSSKKNFFINSIHLHFIVVPSSPKVRIYKAKVMFLFILLINILLSMFSTAVMAYISMATPIGPWIAPPLYCWV